MFSRLKSKDLVFGEPYYSSDEWANYLVRVYPFKKPHDNGLSQKMVEREIKKSKDKMIAFKNEFAIFGRRACAFFGHISDRYIQVETYGFFPEIIHESLKYVTRYVVIYDLPNRKLPPVCVDRRRRTIRMIQSHRRGLLIRTNTTMGRDILSISNDLRLVNIHQDDWEITNFNYPDKFRRKLYADRL